MIFSPDLAEKILNGEKTQTRRPSKDGICDCRYTAGRTYAIQPGRGRKAVGRIRILETSLVPLGSITTADAHAEGFRSTTAFAQRWADLYGPDRFYGHVWRIVFELVSENEKRARK